MYQFVIIVSCVSYAIHVTLVGDEFGSAFLQSIARCVTTITLLSISVQQGHHLTGHTKANNWPDSSYLLCNPNLTTWRNPAYQISSYSRWTNHCRHSIYEKTGDKGPCQVTSLHDLLVLRSKRRIRGSQLLRIGMSSTTVAVLTPKWRSEY